MKIRSVFYTLLFIVLAHSCDAQTKHQAFVKTDRYPAAAGRFYPKNPDELLNMLNDLFSEPCMEPAKSNPLAIIVPHAGYVFSGRVAAAGFKQIDRDRTFKHIFLIGSSHTMSFNGASIYCQGDFLTPLGKVVVDTLAQWLVDHNKFISDDPRPHATEHSLEVQLPFLKYWLKNDFTIVPIIIGGQSEENCRKLASSLEPYFHEDNLFVISTDFSHYPGYDDAKVSDTKMAEAILTNSCNDFMKTKRQVENANTNNLVTALCGWTSVLTLMHITEKRSDVEYQKIIYRNSGDSDYGNKEKVVGYHAICVVNSDSKLSATEFRLTDDDKIALLKIARQSIYTYVTRGDIPVSAKEKYSENLAVSAGVFVTLKSNNRLRGCIGNFMPDEALYKTVQDMAIAAATQDPRFAAVSAKEVQNLEIEISVLTPLKKVSGPEDIVLGKHGIYIRKGTRSGTFLPQVATETGWSKEEFLGHCSQDKAHLDWEGWKTAELYAYEALVFNEMEYKDKL